MTDHAPKGASELVLYQTEDGRTRIECRFEGETVWLTQALIAELFQKDVRTINEHLVNIFDEGELSREATIRKLRMVRTEGKREVTREIEHYNLDAILAVGFRVRSHRGTQFRQWAMARLSEYLVKGAGWPTVSATVRGEPVSAVTRGRRCWVDQFPSGVWITFRAAPSTLAAARGSTRSWEGSNRGPGRDRHSARGGHADVPTTTSSPMASGG